MDEERETEIQQYLDKEQVMNMRKITSMTLFISLLVLIINSVVLYVVPEGRVAYWADWKFLGLTKSDWGEQHTTVGILFAVAGILHIVYNWKPIVAYMKNRAREVKIFTGSFNIAMVVTALFVIGTYFSIPPMSTIITISESIKGEASQKYGEPPYGHAESSSLKMFAKRENLDLPKSMELLEAAGIMITGEKQTIKDIAKTNSKSPNEVYQIIKPALIQTEIKSAGITPEVDDFINGAKSGLGKKKMVDLCAEYGLDLEKILNGLKQLGITADPEGTLKEIGEANGTAPMQIYEKMVEVVSGEVS